MAKQFDWNKYEKVPEVSDRSISTSTPSFDWNTHPVVTPTAPEPGLLEMLKSTGQGIVDTAKSYIEPASDYLMGQTQGVLFGGAEEAGAGLQTLLDEQQRQYNEVFKGTSGEQYNPPSPTQISEQLQAQGATGDIGPTTSSELYNQAQSEEEKRYAQAEERSPYLTGTGKIAGAIGGGLALAGATGLGTGAKLLGAASKVAPGAAEAISAIPGLTGATTRLAGRALATGVETAPLGAIQGGLESTGGLINATPEEQQQLIEDIKRGTLTATALGAGTELGIGAIKAGAKGFGNKFESYKKDSPLVRTAIEAYEKGKQGLSYGSEKVQSLLKTLPNKYSNELVDKINIVDKNLGKEVGNTIQKAEISGAVINIGDDVLPVFNQFEQLVEANPNVYIPSEAKLVIKKLKLDRNNLSPTEVKSYLDKIDDVIGSLGNDTADREISGILINLRKGVDSQLKNSIPEYRQAAERFAEFRKLVPETMMSKGNTAELSNIRYGDLKNPKLKLQGDVEGFLQGYTRPKVDDVSSSAANVSKQLFGLEGEAVGSLTQLEQSEAKRALEAAQQDKPFESIFDMLGSSKKQLQQNLKDKSDEIAAFQMATGAKPSISGFKSGTMQVLTGGGAPVKGLIVGGANRIGGGVKLVSTPVALGKKLYNTPMQNLQSRATSLSANKSTEHLGKALQTAIDNKDVAAKNAILFTILQTPEARQSLNESDTTEDDQ